MKSKQDLTVGNINKKLWAFAIPLMLGNVMQQFYNLVDTWVVGKYIGDNALAAVGSSYSLMTFLTSVILGLCLGSSAFFSITFGEKNIKTTEKRNVYFVCYDRNIFTYTDVCVILSLRPDYEKYFKCRMTFKA